MNKYQEQARRQQGGTRRSSASVWTAAIALILVALAILGFRGSAPPEYFYKVGIAVAVLLLLMRQVARRFQSRVPRSARPDPKSTLNLS